MATPIQRLTKALQTSRQTRGSDRILVVGSSPDSDLVMEGSMKVQTDVKAGGGLLSLDLELELDLELDLFGGGCGKGCYSKPRRKKC